MVPSLEVNGKTNEMCFLSTLHPNELETITQRAKGGGSETVTKPKIVTDYNQHMSGVDIADQLMVYYACGRRALKWYVFSGD